MKARQKSATQHETDTRGHRSSRRQGRQRSAWPWRTLAAAGLLLSITVVAYGPALEAQFIWDDDAYVETNRNLRTFAGLAKIWIAPRSSPQYYPLVYTGYWIEYHLWGLNPAGYHAVNVLLHAAGAILFWRLLLRLNVPGAWLAAAIFALHPVAVESVAWVTERKNVLAGVLALASLLAYFRFSPPEREGGTGPSAEEAEVPIERHWRWYALSLVLFLGALLSKSVTCSLPAVVLVIFWWKRGRITLRDLPPLVPFFFLGLALGLHTAYLERTHVGARGPDFDYSVVDRCLIAGRALWFYAWKLIWPLDLAFWYPRWRIDPYAWWQYAFPAAAVGLAVVLWLLRGRLGRGPLAAVLIFAGVLFPALGYFNVYPMRFSLVADHFQYHASLALIALFAAGCAWAARRLRRDERWIGDRAAGFLLIMLAALTFQQATVYHDAETLYVDTLAKNPGSQHAHLNLGGYLRRFKRDDEALAHFREGLLIAPDEPKLHIAAGATLHALIDKRGDRGGMLDEAERHFWEAIRLNPELADPYNGLGLVMVQRRKLPDAERWFNEALRIRRDYPEALYGMGTVLGQSGRIAEAEPYLVRALELKPSYPEAHHGLSLVLVDQGRLDEAANHLRTAVALDPTLAEAYFMLGVVCMKQHRPRDAVHHYSQALRLKPNDADTLNNLGAVCLELGQLDRAIACFQQSLKLKPDSSGVAENLRKAKEAKQGSGRK